MSEKERPVRVLIRLNWGRILARLSCCFLDRRGRSRFRSWVGTEEGLIESSHGGTLDLTALTTGEKGRPVRVLIRLN